MSTLPPLPAEDDLLRMDMTELEMMSSSELYPREAEVGITVLTAPRPVCYAQVAHPAKSLIPTVIPVIE